MVFQKNYPLTDLNTFGIQAKAENFIAIGSVKELQDVLKINDLPIRVLGGGSNILLTGNQNGLIVKNEIGGIQVVEEDDRHAIVAVGGGVNWHKLVLWALEKNLGGIENLSLIPGSVGAAPIQNIGAYGVELKDVFVKLESVGLSSGKVRVFNKSQCRFGYRDSVFKNELKGKYLISRVYLKLSRNHRINTSYGSLATYLEERNISKPTIHDVSRAVIDIRQSKLPDPAEIGNSGSFFKNPEMSEEDFNRLQQKFPDIVFYELPGNRVKVPAGWLIEKSGWKGRRVGDAGCHLKQALVLVNFGNATGREVMQLAERIQASVKEQFGIELTPEVNIW